MRQCDICNGLPSKAQEADQLYLWLPIGHSLKKLIHCFHCDRLNYNLWESEKCLAVDLKDIETTILAAKIESILSEKELVDSRVLLMDSGRLPRLADFSRVINLKEFVHLCQSEWLVNMLATESFTNYFQPIVYAEDISQVFGQESLLRGIDRDGNVIDPGKLFGTARNANLMFQLDRIARLTAIREAANHKITSHIFINFAPTSIYDPVYCLKSTAEAIEKQSILTRDRIVFEVIETENVGQIEHLQEILAFYRNFGFSIALDDIGAGFSNLNLIHQLRPDFIKLDMELIRNVHQDRYKAIITEKILDIAQNLGIQTIAEGIESPEELNWVRDRGATFVQGYLIAKPCNPPVTKIAKIGISDR